MGMIDQLFSRSLQSYETQRQQEMPLLDYLELCKTDPMAYATAAERHAKTVRVQTLRTRLAAVERQLGTGRVSVCRGGKALLRMRNSLAEAGLTETGWRERWAASRLFLTADGDKGKTWGNETIRWNPPNLFFPRLSLQNSEFDAGLTLPYRHR